MESSLIYLNYDEEHETREKIEKNSHCLFMEIGRRFSDFYALSYIHTVGQLLK